MLQTIKHSFFLIPAILMFLFSGCQKEYVEIVEPENGNTIHATDSIVDLISNVTLKDGSIDDFVDDCNGISIKFPYEIKVDNQVFTLTSEEDLKSFIFDAYDSRELLELVFPITVILPDYSEVVVHNKNQLEKLKNEYSNLDDKDIECVNFVYPITISRFNLVFQKSETVTVNSDKEFLDVIRLVSKDLIVEIIYPILVELWNGDIVQISSNKELDKTIKNASGKCDEKDKFDFKDNEYPINDLLESATWLVSQYIDKNGERTEFEGYNFTFPEESVIEATKSEETLKGSWEIQQENKNKRTIKIHFETDKEPLVWLNEEWEVVTLSSKKMILSAGKGKDAKKIHFTKTDET